MNVQPSLRDFTGIFVVRLVPALPCWAPLNCAHGAEPRRRLPRLNVKHTPVCEVRDILKYSAILPRVEWLAYHVKDGEKGPMVREAKCVPFWIKDEHGLPAGPYHLLIARNVLDPAEVKFFLTNAPLSTPAAVLLLADRADV